MASETHEPLAAVGALRRLLHGSRADTEVVLDTIRRIASSLDAREVLRESVMLAAGLTRCQGAAIYVLDEQDQRLWMRAASTGYEAFIDEFSLEVGAGLTGWTALHREPAMIREHAEQDPRYLPVAELKDPGYQSVLTYPMISPSDRLVGVITLHTEAPHEFTDEDMLLISPIAALCAAAVETAVLYEERTAHVDLVRSLARVGSALSSPAAGRRALHDLCGLARELLGADRCALYAREEGVWRLETAAGPGIGAEEEQIQLDLLEPVAAASGGLQLTLPRHERLLAALHADDGAHAGFAAGLDAGGETIGVLVCVGPSRQVPPSTRELFAAVAAVAALILGAGRLTRRVAARDVELSFLTALAEGGEPIGVLAARAGQLRVELERDYAALIVRARGVAGTEPDAALDRLAGALQTAFPGSVAARQDLELMAWVRVERPDELVGRVERLLSQAGGRAPRLVAGLSGVVHGLAASRRAFGEARDATQIGGIVGGIGPVIAYDELGALRHLWTLARSSARDPFQERIERLERYDEEHGTQLLTTVEGYLVEHGNREKASARLRIHRNTLRQRVERIRAVADIDLDSPGTHFDLWMALGIVRFRELQRQGVEAAGAEPDGHLWSMLSAAS